jgi:hypothetical protein
VIGWTEDCQNALESALPPPAAGAVLCALEANAGAPRLTTGMGCATDVVAVVGQALVIIVDPEELPDEVEPDELPDDEDAPEEDPDIDASSPTGPSMVDEGVPLPPQLPAIASVSEPAERTRGKRIAEQV